MGNYHSQTRHLLLRIVQYNIIIRNQSSTASGNFKHDETPPISFDNLVDHIHLLRQAVDQLEMTQDERLLNRYVKEYCQKMSREEILEDYRQSRLSWPILWIWHLHMLHPLAYYKDCVSQLPDGQLIDPSIQHFPSYASAHRRYMPFFPSVDLAKAAIRQRDFLKKFQKHFLYSNDLLHIDRSFFPLLVDDYLSFIRLGERNQLLVPTFDIDLIWHTHLRNPTHYRQTSLNLCGFVLDHDDSIKKPVLREGYKNTAQRWKNAYQTNYEQNHFKSTTYSSCGSTCGAISYSFRDVWRDICDSVSSSDDSGDSSGGDCGGCGGD
ncbi:unnamed protein product [Adineta ricciae]|uniref:Uncharacterized protein n=1 Tax=Adineta ricciae TaxID=249248 RepID=A0A814W6H9_ADIRI|nr:unnamed protein product [Adineta ricciae]CAF1358770.1 unnamed protein product [Adineta ricciae]